MKALKSLLSSWSDSELTKSIFTSIIYAGSPQDLDVQRFRIIDDICKPLVDTDGDGTPDIKDKCINDPNCQ
jgi:hypothetical protein